MKEIKQLDNADCKIIGDNFADGNNISDPNEGKEFLERLSDYKLQMIVTFPFVVSNRLFLRKQILNYIVKCTNTKITPLFPFLVQSINAYDLSQHPQFIQYYMVY